MSNVRPSFSPAIKTCFPYSIFCFDNINEKEALLKIDNFVKLYGTFERFGWRGGGMVFVKRPSIPSIAQGPYSQAITSKIGQTEF